MTGYTVVTREAEWDDYARAEAIAAVVAKASRCPNCGMPKSLRDGDEPLTIGGAMDFQWKGTILSVTASRCLGCAALELVQRDFQRQHESRKHVPRQYSPGDGLKWQVELQGDQS